MAEDSEGRILNGGCLCGAGAVHGARRVPLRHDCHRSQCRRATGAAFKPFGGIERDKVTIAEGAKNLFDLRHAR